MLRRLRCVQFFLKHHSDLSARCTLIFSAAGCECIQLTKCMFTLYRYPADIRTCTDTDARVMVQNRLKESVLAGATMVKRYNMLTSCQ